MHARLLGWLGQAEAGVVVMAAVSCRGGGNTSGGDDEALTETTQAPIWRSYDDSDDGWANSVVRLSVPNIGGCKGTLVTSRLVLTANHCLFGNTWVGQAPSPNPTGTEVKFGNDSSSFKTTNTFLSRAQLSHPGFGLHLGECL